MLTGIMLVPVSLSALFGSYGVLTLVAAYRASDLTVWRRMAFVGSVIPSFCGLRRGVRKESGRAETLWKRILVVLAGFVCCFLAERDSPS
jgi:hypothetical protein